MFWFLNIIVAIHIKKFRIAYIITSFLGKWHFANIIQSAIKHSRSMLHIVTVYDICTFPWYWRFHVLLKSLIRKLPKFKLLLYLRLIVSWVLYYLFGHLFPHFYLDMVNLTVSWCQLPKMDLELLHNPLLLDQLSSTIPVICFKRKLEIIWAIVYHNILLL